jgi:hypothetical protein
MPSRVCRQSDCWGEKHVSGFRSMLAQQGSTGCTLRTDLRGIAKAVSLRSPFKGGAPFSRKSVLRSVGLHKSLCLETCFSFDTIGLSSV